MSIPVSTSISFNSFYLEAQKQISALNYQIAQSQLCELMRGIVGKTSKNKRAMCRVQELIAQSKTELMCGKRQVILFELLEEIEQEITRL